MSHASARSSRPSATAASADRASSSRSTHEGESSQSLCDRLSRTRDLSQRQLPTDHDYAVSTREYQTDQSSLKPAPTAARPVLEQRKKQRQQQKQPHGCAEVDGSLHIREAWRRCLFLGRYEGRCVGRVLFSERSPKAVFLLLDVCPARPISLASGHTTPRAGPGACDGD